MQLLIIMKKLNLNIFRKFNKLILTVSNFVLFLISCLVDVKVAVDGRL